MKVACEHGNQSACYDDDRWECEKEHPQGHHVLVDGCRTMHCPGGHDATPAELVTELRRLDGIDYEAAADRLEADIADAPPGDMTIEDIFGLLPAAVDAALGDTET